MHEERMKILEMLQDGKISAEEAANLLRQFPEKGRRAQSQTPQGSTYPHAPQAGGGLFSWIKDHVLSPGGPRISLDLQSSPVGQNIAALRLSGKNDSVKIEGYSGNCIKIHCSYILRRDEPQIRLQEENGIYELHYNADALKALKVSCRVPMVMVEDIQAYSTNGRIKIEDVKADRISVETGNGSVSIEDVQCNKFEGRTTNSSFSLEEVKLKDGTVDTSNGKISLEDVSAESIRLQTSNSRITVETVDIVDISASTSNGSVKIEGLGKVSNWSAERSIKASSSNGSIAIDLPREVGLKLDASTTNGNVSCETGDSLFGEISSRHVDAKNQRYDSGENRIKVKVNTTNGGVRIREVE